MADDRQFLVVADSEADESRRRRNRGGLRRVGDTLPAIMAEILRQGHDVEHTAEDDDD